MKLDRTPVAVSLAGFDYRVPRRAVGGRLVLKPAPSNLIGGLVFVGFGGFAVGLVVSATRGDVRAMDGPELGGVLVGLIFVAVGLLIALSPLRIEINRDTSTLRRRRLLVFRKPDVDLTGVRAVQALWNRRSESRDDASKPVRFTHSFQVNLVLDDPDGRRVNLTEFDDPDASRRIAARVAEFLGVPFVDQVPKGDRLTWDWETEGGGADVS